MEMTDRELLELAAKAAGITIDRWHGDGGDIWDGEPMQVGVEARGHWARWNPLTDDGDALRLAVKLGFCVGKAVHAPQRFACPQETDDAFYEEESGDPLAATRRAIVRAAAALAS